MATQCTANPSPDCPAIHRRRISCAATTVLVVATAWLALSADASFYRPSVSPDGRYVAFGSAAPNLVLDDTNGSGDVFLRDRAAGVTARVSVGSAGLQADGQSYEPSIGADGRFVAFTSKASNLVAGDTNQRADVFVRDRVAGATERVSVGLGGAQADQFSHRPAISADGRYIAFASRASNLVSGDTNKREDVFIRDRRAGRTARVSVAAKGLQANAASYEPSHSADGRYVAYRSLASNLVAGDTNGVADVFVRDRRAGMTERVSLASDGTQAGGESFPPSLSATGRYVAFTSSATNLVTGDTNGATDVFVHDRRGHTTRRISPSRTGAQANEYSYEATISGSGRYGAFTSMARNLVAGDSNGQRDVFVRDLRTSNTTRVSLNGAGKQSDGESFGLAFSADGRYIAFRGAGWDPADGRGSPSPVLLRDRFSRATEVVSPVLGG